LLTASLMDWDMALGLSLLEMFWGVVFCGYALKLRDTGSTFFSEFTLPGVPPESSNTFPWLGTRLKSGEMRIDDYELPALPS
jgi:hypothetical protein